MQHSSVLRMVKEGLPLPFNRLGILNGWVKWQHCFLSFCRSNIEGPAITVQPNFLHILWHICFHIDTECYFLSTFRGCQKCAALAKTKYMYLSLSCKNEFTSNMHNQLKCMKYYFYPHKMSSSWKEYWHTVISIPQSSWHDQQCSFHNTSGKLALPG